jgi:hypothetical protein
MPDDLPGTSIRPPVKPGAEKCLHCGRYYYRAKVKRFADGRVVRLCPYCGGIVNPVDGAKEIKDT